MSAMMIAWSVADEGWPDFAAGFIYTADQGRV
jgi:hypothetical protein